MDTEQESYEDYADDTGASIAEYDISAVPNDFNVMTLTQFVDDGWVRIPGFQRHFVWDLARASKLIESLILGLPVPQLFLYEQERDRHLLIDGQQRLMSIYYFKQQRFPLRQRRPDLRRIFDEEGNIPESVIHDDDYFQDFRLRLPERLPGHKNRLMGLKYSTLDEYHRRQLDMRPIRCIDIKQNGSSDDDSAMYEVFNRLNSGGINLRPQEIRTSMYHSQFYAMLNQVNLEEDWRQLLQANDPDLHMKDIEVLLRGFAMLVDGDEYRPSMVKFLNQFSKKCEVNDVEHNQYLKGLFLSFLRATSDLPGRIFINKNNRFNIALYEATFTATCMDAYRQRRNVEGNICSEQIDELKADSVFIGASQYGTTQTDNVQKRLERATTILSAC